MMSETLLPIWNVHRRWSGTWIQEMDLHSQCESVAKVYQATAKDVMVPWLGPVVFRKRVTWHCNFWVRLLHLSRHNRLRQHMYKRFKVGDSEICPCGQAPQNTEHVLQTCSSHKQLRARTWPNHTPLEKKLYGTTEELALTVDYIVASGLTVWQTAAGRTKKKKKVQLWHWASNTAFGDAFNLFIQSRPQEVVSGNILHLNHAQMAHVKWREDIFA